MRLDEQLLCARDDGAESFGIGAGEKIVAALPTARSEIAGLAQRIAQFLTRRTAAAARDLRSLFRKGDKLEGAGLGDRLRIGAGIDHRALPGEDRATGIAGHHRAGHTARAADLHMLRSWVDRFRKVERGVEA